MARPKPKWERVHQGLAPGVVLCHETMVAGWVLRAELVLLHGGALQIRVNGHDHGQLIQQCTLAQGRRHYTAALKKIARPRQLMLAI